MVEVDLFPTSEPRSLEGMNSEERVQAMVEWFTENFDDPAQETPYEGEYIYIWGGPYDAREEIGDAFGDADQEDIDAAVEEIQSDGLYEWAPHGSRIREIDPDNAPPNDELDEPEKTLAERLEELSGQLGQIEKHIEFWRNQPPGIGHNGPPNEFVISPDDGDLLLAEQSAAEVRAELARANPATEADIEVLERAEGRFSKLLAKIKALLKKVPAFLAEGAVKAVGGCIAVDVYNDPQGFVASLGGAVANLGHWIGHLSLPL